jgi:CHAD domain-containing protein
MLEAEIVAANPPLEASLCKIRKAAETFVSLAGPDARDFINNPGEFHDALGALRDAIAPEVGWLATNWKIDIEASLAGIIPGARTA